jgi:hypothetical protein
MLFECYACFAVSFFCSLLLPGLVLCSMQSAMALCPLSIHLSLRPCPLMSVSSALSLLLFFGSACINVRSAACYLSCLPSHYAPWHNILSGSIHTPCCFSSPVSSVIFALFISFYSLLLALGLLSIHRIMCPDLLSAACPFRSLTSFVSVILSFHLFALAFVQS